MRRTIEFLALAASVMIGELFPIEAPRRSGDGEITVSVMFSFALLLGVGLVPALVAQLLASVVQDAIARKPWWQIGFNIGQYTLSLSAAAVVLSARSARYTALRTGGFHAVDLLACSAAPPATSPSTCCWSRARPPCTGHPVLARARSDLSFGLSVSAVLLCLAPVVVTVLQFSPILYPLLLVPLVGVYLQRSPDRPHRHRRAPRSPRQPHRAAQPPLVPGIGRRGAEEPESLRAGGLLLVDLNGFKEVNDTLGHHHGDLVLKAVGPRLRASFRSEDLVARLGGDEFAVFMPGADIDAAQAAVAAPPGRAAPARSTSTGSASSSTPASGWPGIPITASDVDTLLQRADVAMYRAKASHHPLVIYRAEDDYHSPERLVLATDLRRALADDQLVLHYQPQVELGLGRPVAAEGLVRWQHPQRGLLGPYEFIEVAERTGLIKDLTYRVLDLGLRDLRSWSDDGRKLSLSLNVSVRSLLDRRFPEEVERAAGRARGRRPRAHARADRELADGRPGGRPRSTMRHLAELGVSVAIDDFGTGYSSLAYLTDLPIGELKIDKSFVRAMSSDARNAIVVRSTIELAHNLGLRTVAEGIEDAFTFERLRALGCELAQGFHLSEPLPASRSGELVGRHTARRAEPSAATPAGVRAPSPSPS